MWFIDFFIIRIITIYILIIIWFFYWKNADNLSNFLPKFIYNFLIPVFIFSIILNSQIDLHLFFISVIFLLICLVISQISKLIWRSYLSKNDSQILQYISWTLNLRTFWFAMVTTLFYYDNRTIEILVFILLWQMIYEIIFWNIFLNIKLWLKLWNILKSIIQPSLFAFILWFLIVITWFKNNLNSYFIANTIFIWKEIASLIIVFCSSFLLGLNIGKGELELKNNSKLMYSWIIIKFILWPTVMFCFILVDKYFLHYLLDTNIYKCLIFFSIMPFALNSISQAKLLWINEKKVSYLVLTSTFISLTIIPILIFLI